LLRKEKDKGTIENSRASRDPLSPLKTRYMAVDFGISKGPMGKIWKTYVTTKEAPHGDHDINVMSFWRSAFRMIQISSATRINQDILLL